MDNERIVKEIESLKIRVSFLENRSGRFQKPTPSEVAEYARSINFVLKGEDFCDFYESKGWLVGRSPMKDWKACVRTWKKSEIKSQPIERPFNKLREN